MFDVAVIGCCSINAGRGDTAMTAIGLKRLTVQLYMYTSLTTSLATTLQSHYPCSRSTYWWTDALQVALVYWIRELAYKDTELKYCNTSAISDL